MSARFTTYSWLITALLGLIQVTKANTLKPCHMKPGNYD